MVVLAFGFWCASTVEGFLNRGCFWSEGGWFKSADTLLWFSTGNGRWRTHSDLRGSPGPALRRPEHQLGRPRPGTVHPHVPGTIAPAPVHGIGVNIDLMATVATQTGGLLPRGRRFDSIDLQPCWGDNPARAASASIAASPSISGQHTWATTSWSSDLGNPWERNGGSVRAATPATRPASRRRCSTCGLWPNHRRHFAFSNGDGLSPAQSAFRSRGWVR